MLYDCQLRGPSTCLDAYPGPLHVRLESPALGRRRAGFRRKRSSQFLSDQELQLRSSHRQSCDRPSCMSDVPSYLGVSIELLDRRPTWNWLCATVSRYPSPSAARLNPGSGRQMRQVFDQVVRALRSTPAFGRAEVPRAGSCLRMRHGQVRSRLHHSWLWTK
jgi:hypothetical protein